MRSDAAHLSHHAVKKCQHRHGDQQEKSNGLIAYPRLYRQTYQYHGGNRSDAQAKLPRGRDTFKPARHSCVILDGSKVGDAI